MAFRAATRPKASVAAERTTCRHLKEVIGADRRLSRITPWDIRRYRMKRLETVGAKTVNNELLVLTAVLKNARLWTSLRETYEPLPVLKRGPGQALTPEQTAKLIETAKTKDHWFVALCAAILAYATGCRSGEIKKLRLGDYLLPADLSKHTTKSDPLHGRMGFDPTRHQTSWDSAWEALKQAAGLPGFRFHDPQRESAKDAREVTYQKAWCRARRAA